MEYININGRYYECTKEIHSYIMQLDRELIFYKLGYEKTLKINAHLSKKVKHYYTLAHVYKVELGRCVRKLTRIYEKQMQLAVLAYTLGKLPEKPHEYVDRWRQM